MPLTRDQVKKGTKVIVSWLPSKTTCTVQTVRKTEVYVTSDDGRSGHWYALADLELAQTERK